MRNFRPTHWSDRLNIWYISFLHPSLLILISCSLQAPEILAEKGYDESSDWWSAGILMYEMLYGMAFNYPPLLQSNISAHLNLSTLF